MMSEKQQSKFGGNLAEERALSLATIVMPLN
jgi:hypothetical protein